MAAQQIGLLLVPQPLARVSALGDWVELSGCFVLAETKLFRNQSIEPLYPLTAAQSHLPRIARRNSDKPDASTLLHNANLPLALYPICCSKHTGMFQQGLTNFASTLPLPRFKRQFTVPQMIEFQDVSHDYGGGALFESVTVSLEPGSFHFLTGPSGAGKSTFLKLCYGELRPSRGSVTVGGTDLRAMSRDTLAEMRGSIGVVHQDCQFLDHLSLRANVGLPLSATGRALQNSDIEDLLNWVGLRAQADALPPTLSGGERQRAALARAVIAAPRVLLADEPTGNLDWDMSQRLLSLMIELNRMGTAILIATHDMNLIRTAKSQVSARVLRIAGRRLQSAGADL